MNQYVTGTMIRKCCEAKKMTQAELVRALMVSDKAVSKWETGRSYPDVTLIEPLARALGISTIELLSGESITNRNCAFNMKKRRSMSARSAETLSLPPVRQSSAAAASFFRRWKRKRRESTAPSC